MGLTHRVSGSGDLGWSLRIRMSKKFPGSADAAVPGNPPLRTLSQQLKTKPKLVLIWMP